MMDCAREDILTFKIVLMSDDRARLVVWENDQVTDIFEAEPQKVRTMARKMLDQALGLSETR